MNWKSVSLLLLVALFSACNTVPPYSAEKCNIPDLSGVQPYPAPPTVLYVHGWQILQRKKNASAVRFQYRQAKRLLQESFPNCKVVLLDWTSTIPWSDCLNLAGEMTDELARQLLLLPKEKRENIVLLGHSIGAGIVIGTAAIISRYQKKVSQIVLLGSAIDANSPIVTEALKASKETPIIVYCPQDGMLRLLMSWAATRPALGAFGYTGNAQDGFDYVQYRMPPVNFEGEWFYNHLSTNYLDFFSSLSKMSPADRKKLESYPHLNENSLYERRRGNANLSILWKTERHDGMYMLQTLQIDPNFARIIEYGDYILASGDIESMNKLYEKYVREKQGKTEKK